MQMSECAQCGSSATFKKLRVRVLFAYLLLPIVFMFLEVVLDWRSTWFKLLWREALDLYIVLAVTLCLLPTPANHAVHFVPLRPAAGTPLACVSEGTGMASEARSSSATSSDELLRHRLERHGSSAASRRGGDVSGEPAARQRRAGAKQHAAARR